jgi:hypothetical protein
MLPSAGWAYVERAQAYYNLQQYDNAWADVHAAQNLGTPVYQNLIDNLTNASGGSQ